MSIKWKVSLVMGVLQSKSVVEMQGMIFLNLHIY